ncbi:MAG: toll/interleukin-1 receptor domain-containing protein [Alphaproteobacteria bacterium]|nr:toll/interleukin-1 receptor domain-containing protein [Alphaproteobacteria bacterium]
MKVFLSHSKRDEDKRARNLSAMLSRFLSARGIDVVFDEHSFVAGEPLAQQIIDGILSSDRFVFVATPEAFTSGYVSNELKFATGKATKAGTNPFIIVLNLQDDMDYLPEHLHFDLMLNGDGKSLLLNMYQVYFALLGKNMNALIQGDFGPYPKTDWVILERIDDLDIIGEGAVHYTASYAVMNVCEKPKAYSLSTNFWNDDGSPIEVTNIESSSEHGRVSCRHTIRDHRGTETISIYVDSEDDIPPGEVLAFDISFINRKAFPADRALTHEIDIEEKSYGKYDIRMRVPRHSREISPALRWKKKGKDRKAPQFKPVSNGIFGITLPETTPGNWYQIEWLK